MDVINSCYRKARKEHTCDLCNCKIEKGEKYHYSFIRNGDTYEWKSHLECEFVCTEIEDLIFYLDGITSDEYQEGLREFIKRFICPKCSSFNYDIGGECEEDKDGPYECFDKVLDCLKKNTLEYNKTTKLYELFPRKEYITELGGRH